MKPIVALVLPAALGVLAGCGSAKKAASGPITVSGRTTIST